MKLVLDTSALIYIVERRVDVGQLLEHEVYVPAAVLEELRLLAARRRKARVALDVLQMLRPRIHEKGGPADKAVLESAKGAGRGACDRRRRTRRKSPTARDSRG